MTNSNNITFGGIKSTINSEPLEFVSSTTKSRNATFQNLNVANTPIVGTTIKAYPPASVFNSPVQPIDGINMWIFNLVDSDNKLIQLPITTNTFFTGCTSYWNLFGPGTGGAWTSVPGFYIGTTSIGGTTISPTINFTTGWDINIYPLLFSLSAVPSTKPQVVNYSAMSTVLLTGGGSYLPAPNPYCGLICSNGATVTTNYLSVGFTNAAGSLNWTPGTGNAVGSFTIYLSYMTLN